MRPIWKYSLCLFVLIFLAVFSTACRSTPAPAIQPTAANPVAIATPTPSGGYGGVILDKPGEDWKVYTDTQHGVSFSIPPTWTEKSPGSLEGPDGYVTLTTVQTEGAGPGALCQGAANREKPARFGATPEIRDLLVGINPACVVLPSADQPADRKTESLYLLWYPAASQPNTALTLRADHAHVLAFAQSMKLTQETPPAEATAEAASACDFKVDSIKPNTIQESGLRIDEFPVAQGDKCSPYLEPQAFSDITAEGMPSAKVTQVEIGQYSRERLNTLNAGLKPYGFSIAAYDDPAYVKLFKIKKNGETLKDNLNWIGQLSVRADGKDFQLPVVDSYNASTYVLSSAGVEPIHDWDLLTFDNIFPVFVGNDLVKLEYDYEHYERMTNAPALVNVKKNGQVIDTVSISGSSPAKAPVRGFWSYQDHWYMELPNLVIRDGKILNDELGYAEIFNWRLLKNKPFYFFRDDGKIQVSYDEKIISPTYDEIIHEPQWTMAILVQLKSYEKGLAFYARRGTVWYYVVIRAD